MPTWGRGWRYHPADSCGLLASLFSFAMSEWSGHAPTKNIPQASLSLRIKQGPILCVDCLSFSSHSFSSFSSAKFPYVVQWHHLRPLCFLMLGSPGGLGVSGNSSLYSSVFCFGMSGDIQLVASSPRIIIWVIII